MRASHFVSLFVVLAWPISGCTVEVDGAGSEKEIGTLEQDLLLATDHGFAWAQYSSGTFTTDYRWAFNGWSSSPTITTTSTGHYDVLFPDLPSYSGNVQVVAYDDNSNRCKVADWFVSSGSLKVQVVCHSIFGDAVNNRFVVQYSDQFNSRSDTTPVGFLRTTYADRSHTPSSNWSYNSAGQTNYVTRNSTGNYTVRLTGLNASNGNAQVTAFGTGTQFCKLLTWARSGTDTNVQVACFNGSGAVEDTRFSLIFTANSGATGEFWDRAFVWADRETSTTSYTPNTLYNWNSITGTNNANTAGKFSTGQYWVNYGSMPGTNHTSAVVTAYGPSTSATYCKALSWDASTNGTKLKVNCYNSAGNRVDSKFSAVYLNKTPSCDAFCNGVCCS